MYGIVVEQRKRTLLDGGSSVPAMPVAGARGCVREDAVVPLAVLGSCRALAHDARSIRAADTVRVVAVCGQTAALSGEGQPVGAGLEDRLVVGWITFVVVITIFFVRENCVALALARAAKVYGCLRGCPLRGHCNSNGNDEDLVSQLIARSLPTLAPFLVYSPMQMHSCRQASASTKKRLIFGSSRVSLSIG